MTPVFNAKSDLVAWFDGENLFDTHLEWVAFTSSGHIFSAASLKWLGPMESGSFQDQSGHPVAWLDGAEPMGGMAPMHPMQPMRPMKPMRPMRPMTTMRPMTPMTPMGGWSQLNFHQWLNH